MIIVADTGPLNYLVLIGHIDLLALLFQKVVIPGSVRIELSHGKAPDVVRSWIDCPPEWLEVCTARHLHDLALEHLDDGEKEAILLAKELGIDFLLMDDMEGRTTAKAQHLQVIGTLGILRRAAEKGLVDF